jgi:hypothetical protein
MRLCDRIPHDRHTEGIQLFGSKAIGNTWIKVEKCIRTLPTATSDNDVFNPRLVRFWERNARTKDFIATCINIH